MRLWSTSKIMKNPRLTEAKFRNDTIDDIVELEGHDKLRVIPLHRFSEIELQGMELKELVKYKVMLKRLWEQQNPTA